VLRHVLDIPALDPSVPLLAFLFLVALGVDYNIFLMGLQEQLPVVDAVARAGCR
jgi:uncharacterized membrane protein YdfJ with MMPL/SSD domain